MPSNWTSDATITIAAIEITLRISTPRLSFNVGSTIVLRSFYVRRTTGPVHITEGPRVQTLRLGKGIVKDVKCLILLDLWRFHPC